MEILLFGKNGQLGWELQRALNPLGHINALDADELDLRETDAVRSMIRQTRPRLLINASAYTAVDRAENESETAFVVNATLPGILAEEMKALDGCLVHYSTDYVFDGTQGRAYTEEDAPNPLNVYGTSKLEGERAIQSVNGTSLIFRTSWVYSMRRDSFVTKVLQWARQNEQLRIVDDQVGSPTWARALAGITALLVARAGADPLPWLHERRGLYHLAGDGAASRLAWAAKILEFDPRRDEQVCKQLMPASTNDFPTPAKRPLFSALSCAKFAQSFELSLDRWDETLRLAMAMG